MVSLYGEVRKLQKGVPSEKQPASLRATVDELKRYATNHFREEEAFMKQTGFPDLPGHIVSHEAFVKSLLEVEHRMWNESISYVIELQHLIVGWLFEHINLMDMAYARFSRGETLVTIPLVKTSPVAVKTSPASSRTESADAAKSSQEAFRKSLRSRLRMTGITKIDREHQQLLENIINLNLLVEELSKRKPMTRDWQKIDQAIDFLLSYGRDHFKGEEAWMKGIGYPQLAIHADEHNRLLDRLQKLVPKLAKDRQVLYVVDMNFFLVEWLLTHTNRTDILYVEYAKTSNISLS
ncbi:MAG: hemerythrin family protein [Magnetococcus sp. DMHC-1]